MEKQGYVSPPTGVLEITIIRDSRPRVELSLDLGIPNFTVFTLKLPLVEDEPQAMSGLVAEAVHVLMDEAASFMMSLDFADEVMIQMYATVLATFKGMSSEADSSKEQDRAGADPIVKTFEGTFQLPMAFVNETQKKVVTASKADFKNLQRLAKTYRGIYNDPTRLKLDQTVSKLQHENAAGRRSPEMSAEIKRLQIELFDYEYPSIKKLFEAVSALIDNNEVLFDEIYREIHQVISTFEHTRKLMSSIEEAIERNLKELAPMFLDQVLGNCGFIVEQLLTKYHTNELVDYVTAATKIKRAPKVRHLELTYDPAAKTTVNDAARVIRQYRNRSLKQQPKPLYVIVYDQMGRPTGTLALGPKFKNQLLSLTQKKGSVDFSAPVSFPDEQAMKAAPIQGIPKAISVGGMTYTPEGVAGHDMALYHGPQDWLVKFPDGRSAIFPGRPTFRNMRRLNFPVPRNRFKWTILPPQEEEQSIKSEEAPNATSGGTV